MAGADLDRRRFRLRTLPPCLRPSPASMPTDGVGRCPKKPAKPRPPWNEGLRRDVSFRPPLSTENTMGILWTIIIGFIAGVIAKLLHPGPHEPSGFILTTVLGIVGAFVATYIGQAMGWYQAGEGAGLIGAIVGSLIVLFVWGIFAPRDPQRV